MEAIVSQIVIQIVLPLLAVVVSVLLIPWIKSLANKAHIELNAAHDQLLSSLATDSIRLVEARLSNGSDAERLQMAKDDLIKKAIDLGIDVAKHNIEGKIESALRADKLVSAAKIAVTTASTGGAREPAKKTVKRN